MVSISAENLTKKFGDVTAVDDVTLKVEEGLLVSLLGPSGCGKTTFLRIIAGLEYPDEGRVYFDEKEITDLPSWKRNVGFVFQKMSVFPHMNVYKNIEWALKLRKWHKDTIPQRVKEMLELIGLSGLEKRYVTQLSGGQAQRIVIARALAPDPSVLLLDEPLSMLDAKLREELKNDIQDIHKKTKKTTIFVTHDQDEAFSISDVVFIMKNGKLVQRGTPMEIYNAPTDPFVAEFIGTNNFFKGKVKRIIPDKEITVETNKGLLLKRDYTTGFNEKDNVLIYIRADDVDIITKKDSSEYATVLEGKINKTTFTGKTLVLEVKVNDTILRIDLTGSKRFRYLKAEGKRVLCGINNAVLLKTR